MMKFVCRLMGLATFCVLTAAPAQASTITYTDTFDPADVFMTVLSSEACVGNNVLDTSPTPCQSLSWTHELAGYLASPSGDDVLTSATLTINYRDDGGAADSEEKYSLTWDLGSALNQPIAGGPGGGDESFDVFAGISDGLLSVIISASAGDFYFLNSVLDAQWDDAPTDEDEVPAPVPEPGSLMLLGTGLLLVAMGVRRARRS